MLTGLPSASFTIRRLPSLPCSPFSSDCSIPERPKLSVPTLPSSCPASVPCGYTRRGSSVVPMPGIRSFWTVEPLSSGSLRAR